MEIKTPGQDDTKASCPTIHTEPAQLDKYTILELARLPSITREAVVEDWLESVYGKTATPAKVPCEETPPPSGAFEDGSEKSLETCSRRDCSAMEGRAPGSRPPTTTERSAPCDVDTAFMERKVYKWRIWETESV